MDRTSPQNPTRATYDYSRENYEPITDRAKMFTDAAGVDGGRSGAR